MRRSPLDLKVFERGVRKAKVLVKVLGGVFGGVFGRVFGRVFGSFRPVPSRPVPVRSEGVVYIIYKYNVESQLRKKKVGKPIKKIIILKRHRNRSRSAYLFKIIYIYINIYKYIYKNIYI